MRPPTRLDTSPAPAPAVAPAAAPARPGWTIAVGVFAGLAVALVWASWAVATRFAMTTTLQPQDVTFLRFAVASLFLWPVLLAGGGLPLRRIGWHRAAVMVAGAGAPFMLLTSTGMVYAPASHVGTLMIGAMPIFVAGMSALFFRERFDGPQLMGFAAVIAGVAAIGGHAVLFDRGGSQVWRGDLLFLLCGALFACYTLAQRRSGITSWQAAALVNIGSCIIFAPIYLGFLESNLLRAPWREVLFQAAVQGIWVAILGLFFYGEAVRRLGASRAAVFGALTPGLAALLGVPLLGEIPGAATIAGVVLVSLGVLLVSGALSRRRAAPGGPPLPRRPVPAGE